MHFKYSLIKVRAQDNHLGTVQFTLSDIVRSESIERVENLDNGGRIIVTFYRASIVDEMMVDGLRQLIKKETNWTEKDLRNVGLTLRALVGEEPFSVSGDASCELVAYPKKNRREDVADSECTSSRSNLLSFGPAKVAKSWMEESHS